MKKNLLLILSLCLFITVFSSCKKDPEPVNEEELITTVKLTFTPSGGGAAQVATWKDLDGDGAGAPVLGNVTLDDNTTYTLTIELLDESVTPAEDITEEVEEEGAEHQFFFSKSATLNATWAYADDDGQTPIAYPVGLTNTFTTGNNSTGTFTVILRHELDKSASGVSTGNIANAGGSTDVTANFNITIN